MGFFSLVFPWGLLLQALALVHFVRRRPDTFWLWIIVFLGPLGAAVYIAMEVVPDLGLLRQSYDMFGRRKRIAQLEVVVQENPAAGNFEELADLYLDSGEYAKARACYDKAISSRTHHIDPIDEPLRLGLRLHRMRARDDQGADSGLDPPTSGDGGGCAQVLDAGVGAGPDEHRVDGDLPDACAGGQAHVVERGRRLRGCWRRRAHRARARHRRSQRPARGWCPS